jgi:ABC-type sugar transport system permease subunit
VTEVYSQSVYPTRHNQMISLLQGIYLWQLLLGIASLAGLGVLWAGSWLPPLPAPGRWLLTLALLLTISLTLLSIPLLQRRDHRGRVIVLLVNYLGFLVALLAACQRLGVFLAIDALSDTFHRAIPFLVVMALGFSIFWLAGRAHIIPRSLRILRRTAWNLIKLFAVLALLAVGLFNALLVLLGRLATDPLALGLLLAALACGFVAWLLWRDQAAAYFQATKSQTEMLNSYLLLSPNLLGFLIFFAGPLLFSLYVSFTEWSAFGTPHWVGLQNYSQIFSLTVAPLASPDQRANEVLPAAYDELTRIVLPARAFVIGARDKFFWLALRNTLFFCMAVVPLSIAPALLLANILNSKLPGVRFFRALYFLPSVTAVVGVAAIWGMLFSTNTGIINYAITSVVNTLNQLPGLALTDPQLNWLSSSHTALHAIVIVTAWRLVGLNTILFLAGLQGIPADIYEAAEVDGAGIWEKFAHITVPLLAPTTFFILTTTVIQSLQVFDEVIMMMSTHQPEGPSNSTLTAVLYLYQTGFKRFKLGYASAVAWVLFLIIFAVTLLQFQLRRTSESD